MKDEANCNMLPLALCCSVCILADFSEASGAFLFNAVLSLPFTSLGAAVHPGSLMR